MKMINVAEARELIYQHCTSIKMIKLPLGEGHGLVLAADIISTVDTPPFHQSAMDGYAFSFADWDGLSSLKIAGELPAGKFSAAALPVSSAIRIFTGAPVPAGADTVVIQEKVKVEGGQLFIVDDKLKKGSNIRPKGSQTMTGEIALQKNCLLTAAAISFLASLGVDTVKVFAKPLVSIIVTGNELVKPGNKIGGGEIFESNSFALIAALKQLNIEPAAVDIIADDEEMIRGLIKNSFENDMLILTGGISAGDYDFVETALDACGVIKIFHSVKQKPGKPFYFGKKGKTLVFALPGNPAAVLTCFYTYIVQAISHFTKKEYFSILQLPLADDYKKKTGMTYFLKGKTGLDEVAILDHQESYKMNSFSIADCLIELEAEKEYFKKGALVKIQMII